MRAFVAAVTSLSLGACAVSTDRFYRDRSGVNDWSLCRSWVEASQTGQFVWERDIAEEAARRGLTAQQCTTKNNIVDGVAVVGVVLVTVAAAMAASGGGGGGNSYAPTDYDWAWDQFYSDTGQLVWACRGRQSGRFADQYRCAGKAMSDFTWPAKTNF